MTNRSRTLPRLAIAVLAIVVLAAGCRTALQRPFHYSGAQGQGKVPLAASDVLVAIGEDCRANPERVVLDTEATGETDSHDQVVWYVESEQPGDRVVISAKPAEEQDPDPAKGRQIRDLFQLQYDISSRDETPHNNAIRSGKPKKALLLHKEKAATWRYNIEYYRGDQKLCTYDPDICVQKPGTNGCGI